MSVAARASQRRVRVAGAAPWRRSSARSARRPRWCRPCTRTLAALEPRRDLGGRQSGKVAQYEDLALGRRQRAQCIAQRGQALRIAVGGSGGGVDRIGDGDRPAGAQLVERGIAGDAQQPREERRAAILVAAQCHGEPREHVLGDVLGLVVVADDRHHVAVDVVGVLHVEVA